MDSEKVLTVKNLAQAVLFECELKGQFSDGAWENASPMNHYKAWSDAKIEVGEDIGRNFYVIKYLYGLHTLIEYVGDRMRFMGALATLYPEIAEDVMQQDYPSLPDNAQQIERYKEWAKEAHGEWAENRLRSWEASGLTPEVLEDVANRIDEAYPLKTLRRDLTEIKEAMKVNKLRR